MANPFDDADTLQVALDCGGAVIFVSRWTAAYASIQNGCRTV